MENEEGKRGDSGDKSKRGDEKEGDFYFNERGLMVFTRTYHLKRGYCCKNNCKHCPFKGH